jgi:hypothetical protein
MGQILMLKICHRINSVDDLKRVPREYGVEVDIHAYGHRLVVHHDPFIDAIDFEEWLEHFNHRFLILNTKEEGIEYRLQQLVRSKKIDDYFFLDIPFPALIRFIDRTQDKRVAIRLSYYESLECALKLKGRAEWVLIDLFHEDFPFNGDECLALKNAGYKICLVSPELWGRSPDVAIVKLKQQLKERGILVDAILSKCPEAWG